MDTGILSMLMVLMMIMSVLYLLLCMGDVLVYTTAEGTVPQLSSLPATTSISPPTYVSTYKQMTRHDPQHTQAVDMSYFFDTPAFMQHMKGVVDIVEALPPWLQGSEGVHYST